ncbi:FxLYD domain-containing protein [Streptomyces sp. NPDC058220]|uniref:FxLYD domain-containing protein n=1 Tax=Streptomyces sp. NPDC058220 TaxID=3346387 RepID=UPI0036E7E29F
MSSPYPPPHGQRPQWGPQSPPPQRWDRPGPGWGPPPPPPKKTRVALIVTLSVTGTLVLLVLLGALVSAAGDSPWKERSSPPTQTPQGAEQPAEDVKVTGCEVNGLTMWPAADLEITNSTGAKANYVVSVEFVDAAGTRLGEGMAATSNLAAGQTAREKAQGLDQVSGKVACKVTKVMRYPSR